MEDLSLKERVLGLLFILVIGILIYTGFTYFFIIQNLYFTESHYLLFIPGSITSLSVGLTISLVCILIGVAVICRILDWPLYKKSYKVSMKLFFISLIIAIPLLYLSFFNYVIVTNLGIYNNSFLTLTKDYYSWDRLMLAKVDGYISNVRINKPVLYYNIIFKDGTNINLFDTPYRVNLITKIVNVDQVIISNNIKKDVDASNLEEIKGYYSKEEQKKLDNLFRINHKAVPNTLK